MFSNIAEDSVVVWKRVGKRKKKRGWVMVEEIIMLGNQHNMGSKKNQKRVSRIRGPGGMDMSAKGGKEQYGQHRGDGGGKKN